MVKRKYRTIETDVFGFEVRESGINSKRKGDKNERVLAKLLSVWVGVPFTRVPRSGGLRWKDTANVCGDVVCEVASFHFPFSVETKHLKTVNISHKLRKNSMIYKIFTQAQEDAKRANKFPVVFVRENRMKKETYYVFVGSYVANIIGIEKSISSGKIIGDTIFGFNSKDFFECKFAEFKDL